jgi:hypothetical protein
VKLALEKAECYRAKIKAAIEKCKRFRTNMTNTKEKEIDTISKDKSIKMLKADKGNVTVVMDSEEYEKKLNTLVNTAEYKLLDRDPTTQIEAKVHRELKICEEDFV